MKNAKSSAVLLGLAFALIILAALAILYSMGPTVVEKPVYINRYVEDTIPVYVQPAWWGAFGGGYGKPWKMGSGLPGMPPPPPPPAGPPPPAPPPPAPAPPPPAPAPPPPPAA